MTRRPVTGIVVALLLVVMWAPDAVAARFHTLVAQGKDAVTVGNFKAGEALFREALRLSPGQPEALYGAAFCAQQNGKLSSAIRDYEEVLRMTFADPGQRSFHSLALMKIGEIRLARNEFRTAAEVYGRGVQNAPDNPGMHYGLGLALRGMKQNEAALKEFEEALRLNPRLPGPMVGKASVYYELGDIRRAFDLLHDAVRLEPGNPVPYAVMSRYYAEMEQPYDQRLMLGQYYFYVKDYRRAMDEYRAAQVIRETPESHYMLGVAYLQKGDPVAAEAKFRNALKMKIRPADTTWAQLSYALAKQGRLEEAEQSLRRAMDMNKESSAYLAQLAWLQLMRGESKEATESALGAVARDPDSAVAHRYLGDAYSTRGVSAKAIESYEKSLALDGTQADVYVNLGWAYERSGDYVSAQRNYELFLKTGPDAETAGKVRDQIRELERKQRTAK